MRLNAIKKGKELNYKSHMVYVALEEKFINKVSTSYSKNRKSVLQKAFARIKANQVLKNFEEKLQAKLKSQYHLDGRVTLL